MWLLLINQKNTKGIHCKQMGRQKYREKEINFFKNHEIKNLPNQISKQTKTKIYHSKEIEANTTIDFKQMGLQKTVKRIDL